MVATDMMVKMVAAQTTGHKSTADVGGEATTDFGDILIQMQKASDCGDLMNGITDEQVSLLLSESQMTQLTENMLSALKKILELMKDGTDSQENIIAVTSSLSEEELKGLENLLSEIKISISQEINSGNIEDDKKSLIELLTKKDNKAYQNVLPDAVNLILPMIQYSACDGTEDNQPGTFQTHSILTSDGIVSSLTGSENSIDLVKNLMNSQMSATENVSLETVKFTALSQDGQEQVTLTSSAEKAFDVDSIIRKNAVKVSDGNGELAEITGLGVRSQTQIAEAQASSEIVSVEKQISDFVTEQLTTNLKTDGTQEITMKLNPEELGEISVKIVKTGAEISVRIAAQSEETRKMIESRIPQLVSSLRTDDTAAEVRVEATQSSSAQFLGSFNLSDTGSHQQSGEDSNHYYSAGAQNNSQQEVPVKDEYHEEAKLWQTA